MVVVAGKTRRSSARVRVGGPTPRPDADADWVAEDGQAVVGQRRGASCRDSGGCGVVWCGARVARGRVCVSGEGGGDVAWPWPFNQSGIRGRKKPRAHRAGHFQSTVFGSAPDLQSPDTLYAVSVAVLGLLLASNEQRSGQQRHYRIAYYANGCSSTCCHFTRHPAGGTK